jgi:hypothetical protein
MSYEGKRTITYQSLPMQMNIQKVKNRSHCFDIFMNEWRNKTASDITLKLFIYP